MKKETMVAHAERVAKITDEIVDLTKRFMVRNIETRAESDVDRMGCITMSSATLLADAVIAMLAPGTLVRGGLIVATNGMLKQVLGPVQALLEELSRVVIEQSVDGDDGKPVCVTVMQDDEGKLTAKAVGDAVANDNDD